ncbi:MAG: ScyD/ScyE family protein [Pyrinomonadaceae bacterium]
MIISIVRLFVSRGSLLTVLATIILMPVLSANAQCPRNVLTSGLRTPLGITQSNQNNLVVSESGTSGVLHSGRISIVEADGTRRTLLDGLPSGPNDIGEPSGPAGVFMRGRTLYVAIGMGDTTLPNQFPNPIPSSPIFSSILAIHFSASVERKTLQGFSLPLSAQQTLASGQKVTLSNADGGKLTVELIANFPDVTIDPTRPSGFRNSNPFDLVVVGDQIYVTDGGQNLVRQVDIATGTFSTLATFPNVLNPLPVGPQGLSVEAVPTGIAYSDGQLLVTLFRGFPFPAGTSVVEQVDPQTGAHAPFISGLRTAIDVVPLREGSETHYLVLLHSSAGGAPLPPFFNPGHLLHFETPAGPSTIVSSCLTRPTSMVVDEKTGLTYVTEVAGRIIEIAGGL